MSNTGSAPAKIGVIGAGQMGGGIAHVCALAGCQVVMLDAQRPALDKAIGTIGRNLERQVAKDAITEDARDAAMDRIMLATDYARMHDCQLVIEAATEQEEIKRGIYATLAQHVAPDTIIATNTSSIPITRLAAATDRPGKFIGLHFMNPPPMMPLIEVIRGLATDEATFQAAMALCAALGKTPVVSQDYPGFILNRVLIPMINEAIVTLHEGVGSVVSIDNALKLGASHKMGPLELADFIGLDTCLAIMRTMQDGFGDSKYRPCPLLIQYVEAGWLGRKSGRGFYDYAANPPTPTR